MSRCGVFLELRSDQERNFKSAAFEPSLNVESPEELRENLLTNDVFNAQIGRWKLSSRLESHQKYEGIFISAYGK